MSELPTSNQMFTRDEWTMQGQLYLRPGQDVPFTSRWVRAEWADQEIERLRAALAEAESHHQLIHPQCDLNRSLRAADETTGEQK